MSLLYKYMQYYGAIMGCQDPDGYSGNTAYWFFAFFWLTEGSRNKNQTFILSRYRCLPMFSPPSGPHGGPNNQIP
jgi:hypothetical protein